MVNTVLYASGRNKIKSGIGYKPCIVEITNEYLAYSVGSLAGVAVGGLVGYAISSGAHKKHGVEIIPVSEITSVETKKGFGTAMVYIQSVNRPMITFACWSKKDMEEIQSLLRR